jgi:hypothetical protein
MYEPPLALDEGLERTLAWLRFAGYPVVAEPSRSQVSSPAALPSHAVDASP